MIPITTKEKDVADEYIKEIIDSSISKDYKLLVCPFGYVASGKSTVVKLIAKELQIPRVSGDELRKKLKENNLNYANLYAISEYVTNFFLDQGYGFVFDSNASGHFDLIENIAKKYHLKKIYIKVTAPEEFIINKIRTYNGDKFLADDQEKLVKNYFLAKETTNKIFNNPGIDFTYEVDTSKPNLSNVVENIIRDLKNR